jgi:endonuclease/exonuclease/phosphatase family metal-dependent hydrolase
VAGEEGRRRLRLLSYNIQAGVDTQHFGQYVTRGWKHLLPHRERIDNLNRIARMLEGYDLVGLQEVDSGSLRSGFVDQTEYLAFRAGFPYWHKQVNRNLGKIAQYSNGLLSQLRPTRITEHRLPGLPGRGAIFAHFGADELVVCIMHLALGRRARLRQVAFIGEKLRDFRYRVVMGDLNCGCESPEIALLRTKLDLQEPVCDASTFPSWSPKLKLDHILASSNMSVENPRVVDYPLSDHLPIGIDILAPQSIFQSAAAPPPAPTGRASGQ